jgi:predicted nucleic acid-binding protein
VYLVDTNVISAGAPSTAPEHSKVVAWMEQNSDRLFLSVVTIAEIESGIAKAGREGALRRAARLAEWLETVLHIYAARVLTLDIPAARLAGRLSDLARSRGQNPGFADLAIAATAQSRGFVVLTRNVRHFAAVNVLAHNPFAGLP